MGFLGLGKKKQAKESSNINAQSPEDLRKQFLNNSEESFNLADIPMPPKPKEADFDTGYENSAEQVELPENNFLEEAPSEPEQLNDVPVPPSIEEQEDFSEDLNLEDPVNQNKDQEFTLPDFSEEELNLDEEIKNEPTIEEDFIEPETNFTKKQLSPLTITKPTLNKPLDDKKGHIYLNVNSCNGLLNFIGESQTSIEKINKEFQQFEGDNKTLLQNYKTLHDYLEAAQEELMKIDSSLFER